MAPVRDADATVVCERIFGGSSRDARGHQRETEWPVTCLSPGRETVAVQLHAVWGAPVDYAGGSRNPPTAWFSDGAARYCRVGAARPGDESAPRDQQAQAVFRGIRESLQAADTTFNSILRTWFYLDDILGWYDEFNDLRDDFFTEHRVFDGLVPASTGIGMKNANGAALTAEGLALQPLETGIDARAVPSPKQCSPLEYGSSFSRAVEAALADHRRLYVSGTASIDREGRTVGAGDFKAQMDTTISVVEEILESRGMKWKNVTRAVAYVRRPEHIPALQAQIGGYSMPVAVVPAVICRENLLFELEVDAVSPAG